MSRKSKGLAAALLIMSLSGVSAGVTAAYLQKSLNELDNVITAGDISILLTESSWDPEEAVFLHPRQSIAKDPVVTNTGKNPASVFLEVTVPVRTIATVTEEGSRVAPAPVPLFSFQADEQHWELIAQKESMDGICMVYAYREILAPNACTEPLFEAITAVNYLEGELDEKEVYPVEVCAKAIQMQVDTSDGTNLQIYEELLQQMGE